MVMGRPREATDAFQRFLSEQRQSRWTRRAEAHLLTLAAGADGRARGRLKLVAAGTVHADEGLSAPMVDALLRGRPELFERCLDDAPSSVNEPTRLSLEVELDAGGSVQQVKGGTTEWSSFVGCATRRLKEALRLPRGAGGKSSWLRIDLVLAVRR
jgi:hypothetical protein